MTTFTPCSTTGCCCRRFLPVQRNSDGVFGLLRADVLHQRQPSGIPAVGAAPCSGWSADIRTGRDVDQTGRACGWPTSSWRACAVMRQPASASRTRRASAALESTCSRSARSISPEFEAHVRGLLRAHPCIHHHHCKGQLQTYGASPALLGRGCHADDGIDGDGDDEGGLRGSAETCASSAMSRTRGG